MSVALQIKSKFTSLIYMTKNFKIILLVLALISITTAVFIIFEWGLFDRKEKEAVPQPIITGEQPTPPTEEQAPTDLIGYPELKEMPAEDKKALASPVDEKYFEGALIDEKNPQVISFFLEAGEPIKAIFKGKIRTILKDQRPFPEDNPFDEVILDREDGQFYASYVIFGEVLIKEGDIIEKGQIIAKAKEGGLAFRSMTNLSLWLHDKEGEFIELSKEMFK
jgi:hypothetical protein